MGGCCCSSRRTERNILPAFYYFPRVPEEQVPLSTQHAGASGISAGFLVHPGLQTSASETHPPSPASVPNVVDSETLPTASGARGTSYTKTVREVQLTISDSVRHANVTDSQGRLDKYLKAINGKDSDFEQTESEDIETELKKSSGKVAFVVEECPTCLEEYDEENPKILTKCGHDFHLPCILEWMERSDRCPVCDKEIGIDEMMEGCIV